MRYKLAMALARLAGFKPFYVIQGSSQPIWARTREDAICEARIILPGDSTSRILPLWIKAIRGF